MSKNSKDNRLLIVIDLDDTLLTDDKKIPEETAKYLKSLQDEGHLVMLASGRPVRALMAFATQIGLNCPLICYNGAYCFHPYDENFPKFAFTFPKEIIKDIYNECEPYINNVMCETDTTIWQKEKDEELEKFFWHDGMDITYGDIRETLDSDPWTMVMCDNDDQNNDKIIEAAEKHKGYKVRFWYNCAYSEVYYKKTSKLECLKRICKYYKISKKNVVAIGDAENDVSMIEWAGIGVAMINGTLNARRNANIVTKHDNNHEGVMAVLKEIMNDYNKNN